MERSGSIATIVTLLPAHRLRAEHGRPPARAEERAEQRAGDVAAEVEVAGDAGGQEVLRRFQPQAEQGGEQRGHHHLARERQVRRQRGGDQQAERQVAEDVEDEVFEDEVLRPWRPQPVERRQPAVAPAGEWMQAGIGDQQGVGEREGAGERVGGPGGHEGHCASLGTDHHPVWGVAPCWCAVCANGARCALRAGVRRPAGPAIAADERKLWR